MENSIGVEAVVGRDEFQVRRIAQTRWALETRERGAWRQSIRDLERKGGQHLQKEGGHYLVDG
jgi:hypothetical protein